MSSRRPVLRKQSTLVTEAEQATRQRRHEWIERSLFISFGTSKTKASRLIDLFTILAEYRLSVDYFKPVEVKHLGKRNYSKSSSISSDEDVFSSKVKTIDDDDLHVYEVRLTASFHVVEGIYRRLEDVSVSRCDHLFTDGTGVTLRTCYPKRIDDLKCNHNRTITLNAEHPGHGDAAYYERRVMFSSIVALNKHPMRFPPIVYTHEEHACWAQIYTRLEIMWPVYACELFQHGLAILKSSELISATHIPDVQAVSRFLESRTGFRLRPATGLCSAREFLACLALRAFPCVMYMRHASRPGHSPEPDLVHEILGHVPMFLIQEVADFSQQLGLASIGATDIEIEQLARLYWYSIEFGLIRENGEIKVMGAGLLSAPDEMEYAMSDQPLKPKFDPELLAKVQFDDTTLQSSYAVLDSMTEAMKLLHEFCANLSSDKCFTFNKRHGVIMEHKKNHKKRLSTGRLFSVPALFN